MCPFVSQTSVNIFKGHPYLSYETDSFHITHIASTGSGEGKVMFLFRSAKNSGCHNNLRFQYTYNGKSGHWPFLPSHCRELNFNLTEMLIE